MEACRRLAVDPEFCIVFRDSDARILAAKAAHMPAIMIPDLKQPSAEAVAIAYRILPSLDAAADSIREYL